LVVGGLKWETIMQHPEDLTERLNQVQAAGQRWREAEVRNRAIQALAESLAAQRDTLLEANTLDLETSRDMAVPEILLEWNKLTPERLQATVEGLRRLAACPDPLAAPTLYGHWQRVPLGTIAFVYEAIPQLAWLVTAMALKTGNVLVLKGGHECSQTQSVFLEIVRDVLAGHRLPEEGVMGLPPGTAIADLLGRERLLRLAILYGRPTFVQQLTRQATISVVPAAIGNCFYYLSPTADLKLAVQVLRESWATDPDPVNAVEGVILHRQWRDRWAVKLWQELGGTFKLQGCVETVAFARQFPEITVAPLVEGAWLHPPLDRTLRFKTVETAAEAITWIDRFSSGHADGILTDSLAESTLFAAKVRSSSLFVNTSNRFERYGVSATDGSKTIALGMTGLKSRGAAARHPGPIDLYALTTTKRIVSSAPPRSL
jgi:glutamate-5-semialdehyde dehydrogenase